jgi:hypothetical protein
MSKRVKIAVIREATLNAKPTDTHYLAEGGLQILRRDARALKGTTLYYEVLVDLGEVKGFDFIPGRDVPVYLTESEPVLALDPQSLKLVDWKDQIVDIQVTHVSFDTNSHSVDSTLIPQNAPVEPIDPVSSVTLPVIPASSIVDGKSVPEAPVKRRPGRPKKVVAEAPVVPEVPELVNEPVVNTKVSSDPVQGQNPDEFVEVLPEPDFQVTTEKQDDESTFLIDPEGVAPTPAPIAKPEFSFDMDEDEAPPPPPVRNTAPQNLGFEVEEEETPAPESAPVVAAEKPEPIVTPLNTEDFGDVEPGLFDE